VSSQVAARATRSPGPRQAERVERLLAAGAVELETVGHEALTIRTVAAQAGISPAAAYTYVTSKDHLFAELFCRLLVNAPQPQLSGETPAARLRSTIRHLTEVIASAPATAAAATRSLLGSDPSVAALRLRIGALVVGRFRAALGEGSDIDDAVLDTMTLAFFGALLQAGMGLATYPEIGDRLDRVVDVVLGGRS
jgi:AcrR family transcriptional regulator